MVLHLNNEEFINVKNFILHFTEHTALYPQECSEAEISILPQILELLLRYGSSL